MDGSGKIPRLAAAMLVASLAVVALAGSGCGGSSDDDDFTVRASTTMTAATPRLTKAQFVGQINRTCREAWATVRENWRKYTSWQDDELGTVRRFEDGLRSSLLAGIDFHIFDNVRRSGSPPGEEERIEEIIGPFQEAVERGQQKLWRARTSAQIPPHFAVYNTRARAYGLTDCLVDDARLRGIAIG